MDTSSDPTAIYAAHSAQVYRLAYRLTGNRADAEDLTQEVFIRVLSSMDRYEPGNFAGWIHRITTNLFLDSTRRASARPTYGFFDGAEERIAGRELLPEAAVHDAGFDPDIEAALAALSPEFRVVVVLCDVERLSYEEIAAMLGVKIGTVRSRIHRGRAMLRKQLSHREPRRGRLRVLGAAGA